MKTPQPNSMEALGYVLAQIYTRRKIQRKITFLKNSSWYRNLI